MGAEVHSSGDLLELLVSIICADCEQLRNVKHVWSVIRSVKLAWASDFGLCTTRLGYCSRIGKYFSH